MVGYSDQSARRSVSNTASQDVSRQQQAAVFLSRCEKPVGQWMPVEMQVGKNRTSRVMTACLICGVEIDAEVTGYDVVAHQWNI